MLVDDAFEPKSLSECKIIIPGRGLAKEDGINFEKNDRQMKYFCTDGVQTLAAELRH